jgi:hypothetical protein
MQKLQGLATAFCCLMKLKIKKTKKATTATMMQQKKIIHRQEGMKGNQLSRL